MAIIPRTAVSVPTQDKPQNEDIKEKDQQHQEGKRNVSFRRKTIYKHELCKVGKESSPPETRWSWSRFNNRRQDAVRKDPGERG
jgi:hypothetical protein